ncbi:MAG: hypothetical protein J5879_01145 [Clostridia bacterium]|nr:hypothetical protein [Clostridia bacterium]
MKKIIVLLLCAIFVLSALVSCADKPNNPSQTKNSDTNGTVPEETEPEETEDPAYIMDPDTIAKADQFKGEKLTILANSGFWPADDIYREEDSEDPVDSAIFNRNESVKNTYHFDIEVVEDPDVSSTIKNAYLSGISDYDVAAFCAYQACPLAAENIFQDLTQIENLDLSKKYWDQGLFEGLSIDGKLFYITGDISTKANAGTFLMMFNKKLANDYDLEDLYEVVRKGDWTLDYLNGIIKEHGYEDDGNSKVDVYDKFGMGIQIEAYLAFYFGAGGRMVLKDNDQMPYLALNTEKNISIIDKIYDLTQLDNKTIDAHDHLNEPPYSTNEGFASTVAFKENRCLFYLSNAANILGLREMDADFGVLPTPKYDKSQEDYYSYVYHGAALYVIPVMNKRTAFTGFALEALAAESYKRVTPAYYEQTLKRKSQRDSDSWDMLDIVFRNRLWDLGYYARWSGLDDSFIAQIKKGTGSFAKWYKSASRSAQKAIDKYVKAYNESSSK